MKTVVTFLAGAAFGAGMILGVMQDAGSGRVDLPLASRPVVGIQRSPSTSATTPANTSTDVAPTPVMAVSLANVSSDKIVIPVAGIRASDLRNDYNDRRGAFRTHHALDILAPRGTPVVAAVDGTIRKLFLSNAGGITIYQFDVSEERVYYYAHLERYALGLHEGQQVKRGEVLGYVGTTGNAPPGTPHLHFSIEVLPSTKEWWKGSPVDPHPILVEQGVTVSR